MTVLYRLDANADTIASVFGTLRGDDPWAGGHIAPASFAPIITAGREFIAGPRQGRGRPRLTPRVWGVPPPPNVPYDGRNAVLTVRNPDSPFWVGNLRNSEFRCLIPATSFMEWSRGVDREGRRMQDWFAPTDQPIFAFAGVWKDSEVPSFAMLTCQSNSLLHSKGQERMPVIVPPNPAAFEVWLNGGWGQAKELLQPYSSSLMRKLEPRT